MSYHGPRSSFTTVFRYLAVNTLIDVFIVFIFEVGVKIGIEPRTFRTVNVIVGPMIDVIGLLLRLWPSGLLYRVVLYMNNAASDEHAAFLFNLEDRGRMFLRNVGTCLHVNTVV
jgi:hypothetical protein